MTGRITPSGSSVVQGITGPRRSRITRENSGPHGAHLKIADKDEAAGSSPARPTNRLVTSENAGHCVLRCQPNQVDPGWDEVLRALTLLSRNNAFEQPLYVLLSWVCLRSSVAQRC